MVVTYEDFVSDPQKELLNVSRHFQLPITEDQVTQIYSLADPITNRESSSDGVGFDTLVYPLGWTGHSGIWKKYFSESNKVLFNRLFRSYCELSPHGKVILEYYPGLVSD